MELKNFNKIIKKKNFRRKKINFVNFINIKNFPLF
jgi:hypothetical protein